MKLSEQLREEARQQDELWRKHGDECFSSAESVLLRVSDLAEAYEAETEKRIAELESKNASLREGKAFLQKAKDWAQSGWSKSTEELSKAEARIVELQQAIPELEEVLAKTYEEECERRIKARLAWTPVSAGLPTEPGMYEFLTRDLYNGACIGIYELDEEVGFCVSDTGKPVRRDLTTQRIFAYRRIELPEDGEI